jgi:hypothetical protein
MLGDSRVADTMTISQEGLSSVELVVSGIHLARLGGQWSVKQEQSGNS